MLACSYDRVSTLRQASKTNLDTRCADAIQKHCDRRWWTLKQTFNDAGLSGKDTKRPGLQKAIQWAVENRAVIVFFDLSRFSRSSPDPVDFAGKLRKRRAGLSSCTEAIELTDDNAADELTFHVLAAVAQFMRTQTSKKVKERNDRTVEAPGYRNMGLSRQDTNSKEGVASKAWMRKPCWPSFANWSRRTPILSTLQQRSTAAACPP
jgi:DNA invertase Pin-like site-specific DNA recombinase